MAAASAARAATSASFACSARTERAVVSTRMQGRSSVAINVPAPRVRNALW
jgi:hypothetical protein